MARPKVYLEPRVSTQVRLDAQLHERLMTEAERRDTSATRLINRAIQRWLDQHEGEEFC